MQIPPKKNTFQDVANMFTILPNDDDLYENASYSLLTSPIAINKQLFHYFKAIKETHHNALKSIRDLLYQNNEMKALFLKYQQASLEYKKLSEYQKLSSMRKKQLLQCDTVFLQHAKLCLDGEQNVLQCEHQLLRVEERFSQWQQYLQRQVQLLDLFKDEILMDLL